MGWATKPLGAICEFSNGLWTGKKPPFEPAIVVRNTNFRPHGRLDHSDVALLDVEAKQLAKRRLQIGDIIIEKSGGGPKQPVGRVAYFDKIDGVYSFSNFTSAARVIDKSEVDPEYLIRFLDWCYISGVTEGMQSHSTGIRNLDFGAYKAIEVPLPPLEEQRRIVAVLDEAFAAIATASANAEKNLANARELFSAALSDVLDGHRKCWPMVSLRSAGKTLTGNTPKTSDPKNFGGYIPFIKPGDFRPNGSLNYANEALSVQGASASRLIPAGSALMVCIGATIGKSAFTEADVAANQQVNAFIPSPGLSGKFAFYQFLTKRFQRAVLGGSGQATLPIINKSKWSDLEIYVPDNVQEQLGAVDLLDAIMHECDALEATFRSKMIALNTLKQSFLHRAFTGELIAAIPDTIAA